MLSVELYNNIAEEFDLQNFESVKNRLQNNLELISFHLTPENFEEQKGAAKSVLAELNKVSKAFIDKGKEIAMPYQLKVDAITGNAKNLALMCSQKREELLKPLEEFEQKKKSECFKLLQLRKEELYLQFQISKEC
jgi:hypothetical protein